LKQDHEPYKRNIQKGIKNKTRQNKMRKKTIFAIIGVLAVIAAIIVGIRLVQKPAEENVIKIGAILPLTGPGAIFAQYIKEGIELALDEINKASPLRVSIVYEDSKNQPKEGVAAYNKIVINEKPPIIIVALSSVAKALAPLAENTKTIQVYIAVAIPKITDGNYQFRVYPNAYGMAGVMAHFIATQLGAKTAAVIYINDDFGRVSLEAFKRELSNYGGKVIYADSYELQQTDFRPQITKLKNLGPAPDVIYLSGYGPSYGVIVRQLKELGVKVQLTADMTLGLPNTLEQVGNAAEGVYFVDGKMSFEFIEKFKQKYGKEPSSYAGYAYDIVNILYTIAENKGLFKTDNIRQGLHEIRDYRGAMGNISIRDNGDANLEFVVKWIKDGQPFIITSREGEK
jgi:branched-chain amino acid transport system substrate-binding protein